MNKRDKAFLLNCPCSSCSTKTQFECARINYDELCERMSNWKMLVEYIEQLENAIDEACEELEDLDKEHAYECNKQIIEKMDSNNILFGYKKKEEWKEYLLRNLKGE